MKIEIYLITFGVLAIILFVIAIFMMPKTYNPTVLSPSFRLYDNNNNPITINQGDTIFLKQNASNKTIQIQNIICEIRPIK